MSRRGALSIAIVLAGVCSAGCQSYRVEYHPRPGFYENASLGQLPEELVLDDGTVIRYQPVRRANALSRPKQPDEKLFQIREEREDGAVILRATLPEHVIANLLTCLQNEEYELIYHQLLSERTRRVYDESGQGIRDVVEFFRRNRHELAATASRMNAGFPHNEVRLTGMEGGILRCSFRPQIAGPFRFTQVDVVQEGDDLKLLMIR